MQSSDAEQNDTTNLYKTLNLTKSATQDEIKKVIFIACIDFCLGIKKNNFFLQSVGLQKVSTEISP